MKKKDEIIELKKTHLVIALLLTLFITLFATKLFEKDDYLIIIEGHNFSAAGNVMKEYQNISDDTEVIGIIGDPHGLFDKASKAAQELKANGVDEIFLIGDLALNTELRYGIKNNISLEEQVYHVLIEVAKTKLPIFVIPGNHETKESYQNAIEKARDSYSNIIDMTKYKVFEKGSLDFIFLPGYQVIESKNRRFIPKEGYYASTEMMCDIGRIAYDLNVKNNTVVLVTHGSPFTGAVRGPGTTYDGRDIGDKVISEIMNNAGIKFSVSGHIHEAGGNGATLNGKSVGENELSDELHLNAGTLETWKNIDGNTHEGMAAILTIKEGKASYRMIKIEK